MKVKIVAQFTDSEGNFAHVNVSDAKKPVIVDVRESIGRQWVNNGWAVVLQEEKKQEPEPEKPKQEAEAAVIETPEDNLPKRRTATLKHKKK